MAIQIEYSFLPNPNNVNGSMFHKNPADNAGVFKPLKTGEFSWTKRTGKYGRLIRLNGAMGYIKQFRVWRDDERTSPLVNPYWEYYDVISFDEKTTIDGLPKQVVDYTCKINFWMLLMEHVGGLYETNLFFERIPMPYFPLSKTNSLKGLSELVNRYKVNFTPYKKININQITHKILPEQEIPYPEQKIYPGLPIATTNDRYIWTSHYYALVKPSQSNNNIGGLYLIPIPYTSRQSNSHIGTSIAIDVWQSLDATQQIMVLPFDFINANAPKFKQITKADIAGTPNETIFSLLYNAATDANPSQKYNEMYGLVFDAFTNNIKVEPPRTASGNMPWVEFWKPFSYAHDMLDLARNALNSKRISLNSPFLGDIYFSSVFLENNTNKTEFSYPQAIAKYNTIDPGENLDLSRFHTDGLDFGFGVKSLGNEFNNETWFQPYDTLPLFTSNYLSNQQTFDKQFQIFNDRINANMGFGIARGILGTLFGAGMSIAQGMTGAQNSFYLDNGGYTGFMESNLKNANGIGAAGSAHGGLNSALGIGSSVMNAGFAKDSARVEYEANKQKSVLPTPSRILRTGGLTMWNSVLTNGDTISLNYEVFSKGVIYDEFGSMLTLSTGRKYNSFRIKDNEYNYNTIVRNLTRIGFGPFDDLQMIPTEILEWLYKKLVSGVTIFSSNATLGDFSEYEWL